jgi:hypothetical protein
MAHAESLKQPPAEQYGSRKKHRNTEAARNKVLTQDIWRQETAPGSSLPQDAKSCYDRVVHAFKHLYVSAWDVPLAPLISMFVTLKHAAFHRYSTGVPRESFTSGDVPFA